MNILVDLHHEDLFLSLQLLFEHRLGHRLYRPIGEEWFYQGYWKIAEPYGNNPTTITQYLGIRDETYYPPDGRPPLNDIKEFKEGYYLVKGQPLDHKAITFDQFLSMDVDVVIASIPAHYEAYDQLIQRHKPNAKLICQFGNILWNITDYPYKNILASVAPQPTPPGYNVVYYHQEFAVDTFNLPKRPSSKKIYSFINCLPEKADDWWLFQELERLMPDWEFRSYGASCRDGILNGHDQLARKMAECTLGYQVKEWGDGYGHCIHNLACSGTPVITRFADYQGKLAEPLLKDQQTALFVDNKLPGEIVINVRNFVQEPNYAQACQAMREAFQYNVNFDKEQQAIEAFLQKLI